MFVNRHSLGANLAHQGLPEHHVEVRQQVILADEKLDLAAQFTERAGQLACNVAAADDGNPLRPQLEFEKTVGRDAEFRARQFRQHGVAAGRDDDVPGAQGFSVDFQRLAADEAGGAAQVRHPLGLEIAFIDPIQAQNIRVAAALQCRPIVGA